MQDDHDLQIVKKSVFLEKLQKSLHNEYWHYFTLERMFDDQKVNIKDFFVSLRFEREKDQKEQSGEFKKAEKEFLTLQEVISLSFEDKGSFNQILLTGSAGMGKSIASQYIATEWVKSIQGESSSHFANLLKSRFDAIFWIKFRDLIGLHSKKNLDLASIIDQCCLRGFEEEKPTLRELRDYLNKKENSSRILFILDGYDEIHAVILEECYSFLNSFFQNIVLHQNLFVTSRPMPINQLGRYRINFTAQFENKGFSDNAIIEFIDTFMFMKSKPGEADKLLEFLFLKETLYQISTIPINLELICWSWAKGELSEKKDEIITLSKLHKYIKERVVKEYMKKHGQILRKLPYMLNVKQNEGLHSSHLLIEDFLSELAYNGVCTGQYTFSRNSLTEALSNTLKKAGRIDTELTRENLLIAATRKHGFLVSTCRGGQSPLDQEHYFIHTSFQESSAAEYIQRILIKNTNTQEYEKVLKVIRTKKYSNTQLSQADDKTKKKKKTYREIDRDRGRRAVFHDRPRSSHSTRSTRCRR